MKLTSIIDKIINLPIDFLNSANISVYDLLEATGYFANHRQISNDDILAGLSKHPHAVNEWLELSSNKRVDSGWYFEKKDSVYIVGYYDINSNKLETYNNPNEACAAFIKYEIEDVRRS